MRSSQGFRRQAGPCQSPEDPAGPCPAHSMETEDGTEGKTQDYDDCSYAQTSGRGVNVEEANIHVLVLYGRA